jgi:hypothetical protein
MPTVVATVGASTANSFATVAEGDVYCDARLNASAWTDEDDDDQKARALIDATRELNVLMYIGYTVSEDQALVWPRDYAEDPDSPTLAYFESDVIPQRVKDATCELALQFLIAGTTDLAALDATQGVIRKRVDVLETEWAKPYERAKGLDRFPRVMALVRPLLIIQGNSVPLVRG